MDDKGEKKEKPKPDPSIMETLGKGKEKKEK